MKSADPRSARLATNGFTLVEIMIVVVIIGLLAALAIPAFQRVRCRSQNSTVANGFRVFSQAFETYATQNGAWPANVGPRQVRPGMSSADFKVSVWKAPLRLAASGTGTEISPASLPGFPYRISPATTHNWRRSTP